MAFSRFEREREEHRRCLIILRARKKGSDELSTHRKTCLGESFSPRETPKKRDETCIMREITFVGTPCKEKVLRSFHESRPTALRLAQREYHGHPAKKESESIFDVAKNKASKAKAFRKGGRCLRNAEVKHKKKKPGKERLQR